MARTTPGPVLKRESLIPRTFNSLNLSKDIVIFDGWRIAPLEAVKPLLELKWRDLVEKPEQNNERQTLLHGGEWLS